MGERQFGFNTVSWALGQERCCIELERDRNGQHPTHDQLLLWRDRVNELIREALPISVLYQLPDDDHEQRQRSKDPVKDESMGVKRWISIDGIDTNPW